LLAYVFWHRPTAAGTEGYVSSLAGFQRALAAAGVPGFLGASVHAVPVLPWTEAPGFEDWYLVENSAALDPLDEAAVSGARQAAHDEAAARAAWGSAGLYRLRLGRHHASAPGSWAHWLSKPAGLSYADFFARLAPRVELTGAALWGRQMTLGPTPEFCLVAGAPVAELPFPVAVQAQRERIWPAR
jgi:hypothetical protein